MNHFYMYDNTPNRTYRFITTVLSPAISVVKGIMFNIYITEHRGDGRDRGVSD